MDRRIRRFETTIGIGEKLASDIPAPVRDPVFYLKPTDKSFSLKTPSVNTVYQLLTIH